MSSPKTTLVRSLITARTFSALSFGTKTVWIPSFSKFLSNLMVPPYRPEPAIISSPLLQMVSRADETAAIPLPVQIAPAPPSSAHIFCAKAAMVGLPILV